MDIKVALFDVYGTLLKYKNHNNYDIALYNALQACKIKEINIKTLSFTSLQLYTTYKSIIDQKFNEKKLENPIIKYPEIDILDIWNTFFSNLYNLALSKRELKIIALHIEKKVTSLMIADDTKDILCLLKKNKIKLGIVSNAQFYTPIILRNFLNVISLYFLFSKNLCFYSYKLGFAKPDSLFYKTIIDKIEKMDISPNKCFFIGDDIVNDIEIPRNFGFKTICISSCISSRKFNAADISITSLSELATELKLN